MVLINRPASYNRRVVLGACLLLWVLTVKPGTGTGNEAALVFGADAGVVLTFVQPEMTDQFETVLEEFRVVLEKSRDLIRQQQAEHWRVFRSPDPGPNGSTLYIGFIEPVLRGATYSIRDIARDELPEEAAADLVARFAACLSQPQSSLSLETVVDMTAPPTPQEEASR